jgi:signal transduction histidine kinase
MLLTLVNDILDLSKIEAGSLLLDQTAFDIRQWVNEMAEPGFAKAGRRGSTCASTCRRNCRRVSSATRRASARS